MTCYGCVRDRGWRISAQMASKSRVLSILVSQKSKIICHLPKMKLYMVAFKWNMLEHTKSVLTVLASCLVLSIMALILIMLSDMLAPLGTRLLWFTTSTRVSVRFEKKVFSSATDEKHKVYSKMHTLAVFSQFSLPGEWLHGWHRITTALTPQLDTAEQFFIFMSFM